MLLKTLRNYLPLILIILLALFLRFLWLNEVPNAIGGDELTYILTAKSIFLTGTDIKGTWNPLSVFLFQYPSYILPQAELPYLLFTPIVGLFQFSLFNARLTTAIFSILTVILVYFVAKELFGKRIAVISGLIAAINPWLVYIGRTSYESTFAMCFYLLGFLVLLKAKNWKIIWSVPFLFLAFYSYIATKLIFIPFVLIAILYPYFFINKRKFGKQYLIVFLLSLIIVFVFAYIIKQSPSSRLSELFTPGSPVIAKQVDLARKMSIENPLTNVLENRGTMYLRIIVSKIFATLSPQYLFVEGDSFFSLLRHGLFYVLDALFLLLGLVSVYKRSLKVFFLLVSIVFISIIPHIFHNADLENFTPHITLAFPFLIIFIAAGIDEFIGYFKNKLLFYFVSLCIFILYLLLLINFLNIYFYQNTLRGNFDFHVRLLSKYMSLSNENGQKIDLYSARSHDVFIKYLFYANQFNKNNLGLVKNAFVNDKYNFIDINFLGCNNQIDPTKTNKTIVYEAECGANTRDFEHLIIPRLSDGGESFRIFNDKICQGFSLKPYPNSLKISDFAIEKMSKKQFCETFISQR